MRPIDAERLIKKNIEDMHINTDFMTAAILSAFNRMLMTEPEIKLPDAEPVRHGHWFEGGGLLMPMHKYDEHTNPEAVFYATCSECRVTINCNGVLGGYSYCPHCGAKMDEGKNDDNV